VEFARDAELARWYRDFGTERPAFRLQIAEGAFLSAHSITRQDPAKFFICRVSGKASGKFFTNLKSKLELITLFT
jgi:hypothetical protein